MSFVKAKYILNYKNLKLNEGYIFLKEQ